MRYINAVFLVVAAAAAVGKPTLEEPEALLQNIRSRTAAHLAQLPNITCHEVMNRFLMQRGTIKRLDTVEIEVAIIDHEERFARPGGQFEERVIDRVVQNGTVGNGTFATHVEVIFSEDVADFRYAGAGKKDGRRTFRYDFKVPLEKSQFLVKHAGKQVIAPYEGSVWVDNTTLDLVRVELRVKHIAPFLGVRSVEETIHYQVMHIGKAEVLLPHKSELGATDEAGNYSLNLLEMQSCREFKSDSIVKYGASGEGSAARERGEP